MSPQDRQPYNQRYSQYARRALDHARALAKADGHKAFDSCHLLLGILREESSVGCTVLRGLGLDRQRAESSWNRTVQAVESADSTMSVGMQDALRLAADEAHWLGHSYIGTEHLLLGIARVGEDTLNVLLLSLSLEAGNIRRDIRRLLRTGVTEISIEQARRLSHLSELSRRVLNGAEQIAEQMDHKGIGLAHLLLVLSRERRSACSQILHAAGLDDRALEAALRKARPATGGGLEDILDRAVEQGEALGSHYTGTDHILLALALAPRGARLLRKYGASPAEIERRLREQLKQSKK